MVELKSAKDDDRSNYKYQCKFCIFYKDEICSYLGGKAVETGFCEAWSESDFDDEVVLDF